MKFTTLLWALPFFLQGFIIFFDEFYFHYKRGLPRWELLGHPLDTLTVILCFSWVVFQPASPSNLIVFLVLAMFSSLFVTKDEFVHSEKCSPGEQWLHAVLFMVHPVVLGFLTLYWYGEGLGLIASDQFVYFQSIVHGQLIIVFLFFIYQVIYGSLKWKKSSSQTV